MRFFLQILYPLLIYSSIPTIFFFVLSNLIFSSQIQILLEDLRKGQHCLSLELPPTSGISGECKSPNFVNIIYIKMFLSTSDNIDEHMEFTKLLLEGYTFRFYIALSAPVFVGTTNFSSQHRGITGLLQSRGNFEKYFGSSEELA